MFGAGHNMNKNVQQNRKQLASKRFKFKRNSKNLVYSDKSIVISVKSKNFSKAQTQDAIDKIRANAKKEREKLISIYVIVFTIIVALFIWIMF